MAVVENAGGGELGRATVGSAVLSLSVETTPPPSNQEPPSGGEINGQDDQTKLGQARNRLDHHYHLHAPNDPSLYVNAAAEIGAHHHHHHQHHHHHNSSRRSNGGDLPMNGDHHHHRHDDDVGESFNRDMRALSELFSKLNPMAEEFVPPSLSGGNNHHSLNAAFNGGGFGGFFPNNGIRNGNVNGLSSRRRTNQGKRRMNSRTSMAQREDRIRKTVYVSDIDHQVTEEQLAALFITCGQVVDCRICGDPNSVLRFAFIEFTDEEGARASLSLAGTMLGFYPVRVLPSKTAIAPVNPTFLPRTDDEREMCARTIYCTNIDKKVTQADVKLFFESVCGEVYRIRLLGDYHHSTRIAFVEFIMAESAIAALNCSGVVLGSLPIRVSPSKTPVRPRAPRHLMH